MLRALLLCFWLSLSLSAEAASLFLDDWDDEFQDATAVFLPPSYDWRLLKAQCYQESRLNPLAESPVGAKGLCQFMPGTWREMRQELDVQDVWIPEQSIRAAGYYQSKLVRFWSAERPQMDRIMLALASYNAGAGNLLKAQRLADGAALYAPIIRKLPKVTGHHAQETTTYVERIISRWYPRLLFR